MGLALSGIGLFVGMISRLIFLYTYTMKRNSIIPRLQWQEKVTASGLNYHTDKDGSPYWDESIYYSFSPNDINLIKSATEELYSMCMQAVEYVINKNLFRLFDIPDEFIPFIKNSWEKQQPSLYGRFDLILAGDQLKMLELNADCPSSILEAAVIQKEWMKEVHKKKTQFNDIDTLLIERWKEIEKLIPAEKVYFSCLSKADEDNINTSYIRYCAELAGVKNAFIYINDIKWNNRAEIFTDYYNDPINNLFKLYPYDSMLESKWAHYLLIDKNQTNWIEPPWKIIMSSKALLPVLWQMFPKHPYLLPCYFSKGEMKDYVEKPFRSRQGYNITIYKNGEPIEQTTGDFDNSMCVYQEFFRPVSFDGYNTIIGSWVINDKAAGIGIRESESLISGNTARFVPHIIQK